MLSKVVEWGINGAHFISGVLLVGIVILNAANIVGRYVLDEPFGWADETLVQMMIVSVFLAYPRVTFEAAHIRMDVLVAKLPLKWRRLMEFCGDLLTLILAGTMIYATIPAVVTLILFDQRSNSTGIPLALPQSSIPLGFMLAALALLVRICRVFGGPVSKLPR
jgi:TRAP-type C4-dicarboxylate transport system permease small subunit